MTTTTTTEQATGTPSTGGCGRSFRCERHVALQMRDGVVLYADVYLPHPLDVAKGYPTVLMRNSYDKKLAHFEIDTELFASSGYAVVVQDIRGRHSSEGVHYHGRNEVEDGYDTIEWIAAQEWSNGKVGMTGISYGAALQCAAAISGTRHLASIFHVKAPSDYYKNGARHGGNMLLYLVTISFIYASTDPAALNDPPLRRALLEEYKNGRDWIIATPWKKGQNPLSRVPDLEQFHLDCQDEHLYSDFWRKPLWEPREFVDEYADVPGCYVAGWYDLYHEDSFWPLLAPRKSSRQELVMGPWSHSGFDRVVGDVDFGAEAEWTSADYAAAQMRWFDYSLKGVANGTEADAPVKVFVMGGAGIARRTEEGQLAHGGRWRNAQAWPIPETEYTRFYLRAGGLLSTEPPGDELLPRRGRRHRARRTRELHRPLRAVGPARAARHDRLHVEPPARLPQRRPRLRDVSARAPRRDHGRDQRGALVLDRRRRYGLHRQARRRLPAERRLSPRLRL